MQTILGANGIIGEELARELRHRYTDDIRLVGRNPRKLHEDDQLIKADLLKPEEVRKAVEGTQVAYLTVGLPYRSDVWLRDWPVILQNVVTASKETGCTLIYFDNTYAYPQEISLQKEDTPLTGKGKKAKAKKMAAEIMLEAMAKNEIKGAIARAPEFYGPGKTKGFTNTTVFHYLRKGRSPVVFVRDDVLRTMIYTPDAARAMALIGNAPDTFGQTWHLPCDDQRMTYREFIGEIGRLLGREIRYKVLKRWQLKLSSLSNSNIRETMELLPRYAIDNIFDSSKFKQHFPEFEITTYRDGIKNILEDFKIN